MQLPNEISAQANSSAESAYVASALPVMRRLAAEVGETVTICRRFGAWVVLMEVVPGGHSDAVAVPKGGVGAWTRSRVLIAWLGEEKIDRLLALTSPADLPSTDIDVLKQELHKVRQQGYSISYGDMIPNVATLAAPVPDPDGQVGASLVILVKTSRMPESELAATMVRLRDAALDIGDQIAELA